MKENIFPAIKLTAFSFLLLVVLYSALVWGIAQLAPDCGEGETMVVNGKVVGFAKEGQLFNTDAYFWGRPSAVNYNAAGSGGSNKGPSNPEYMQTVQARIDSFLIHNPGIARLQIPAEMVTASGSGLDPDISPEAAYIQVKRIAATRGITEATIKSIINKHIEQPLADLFGPYKVNVLQLNIALDQFKKE